MCSSFYDTLEHGQEGKWRRTGGIRSIAPYQCCSGELTGNMKGMI